MSGACARSRKRYVGFASLRENCCHSATDPIVAILAPAKDAGMPTVDAFEHEDALEPLFSAEFEFLPRIGEYLSIDTPPGYFKYYNVVEVWHRQDKDGGVFRACIRIQEFD